MSAQTAQSRAAAALASVWQGPLPGCINDPTGRVVLVLDSKLAHLVMFVMSLRDARTRPMTQGEDDAGGHTLAAIVSHDELNAIAEIFSEDLPRATARRATEAWMNGGPAAIGADLFVVDDFRWPRNAAEDSKTMEKVEAIARAQHNGAIEATPAHSIKAVVILDGEPVHVEDMPLHTT